MNEKVFRGSLLGTVSDVRSEVSVWDKRTYGLLGESYEVLR